MLLYVFYEVYLFVSPICRGCFLILFRFLNEPRKGPPKSRVRHLKEEITPATQRCIHLSTFVSGNIHFFGRSRFSSSGLDFEKDNALFFFFIVSEFFEKTLPAASRDIAKWASKTFFGRFLDLRDELKTARSYATQISLIRRHE